MFGVIPKKIGKFPHKAITCSLQQIDNSGQACNIQTVMSTQILVWNLLSSVCLKLYLQKVLLYTTVKTMIASVKTIDINQK